MMTLFVRYEGFEMFRCLYIKVFNYYRSGCYFLNLIMVTESMGDFC